MMQQVEQESSAFYSTGQLWDDGIIDPLQTRNYLGFCMTVIHQAGFQSKNRFGVFRM
jgi:acetyl-CoA carboxylase carboxyltransferase component